MEPLRIGILGAARITELALIKPAYATGAALVAVAARDRSRADAFAEQHRIGKVHDTYDQLLADPDVEAIYNPLPNSLHGPWNRRALEAGKHVLTEKPSASNAADAADTESVVTASGRTFLEGFHYLYHPLIARAHEIVVSGEIGELQRVDSAVEMPAPEDSDPRWSLALGGGALMDLGCYALHTFRALGAICGGEPQLLGATGGERAGRSGVDEWVTADLRFPNGVVGSAGCNMAAGSWNMSHRLTGTLGSVLIPDFINPHLDDRLIVSVGSETRVERPGNRSSYTYQLEAFTRAVRERAPIPTNANDATSTMRLIDGCYEAIGLETRPTFRE